MRYYLKIGSFTVPRVSKLTVSGFYRNEDRKSTFSGGLAVDRGSLKLRISARVRILSMDEMTALEAALSQIVVTVGFYFRGKIVEKNMIAAPVKSYNSGYPDRTEASEIFTDVVIELEEQ